MATARAGGPAAGEGGCHGDGRGLPRGWGGRLPWRPGGLRGEEAAACSGMCPGCSGDVILGCAQAVVGMS